MSKTLKASAPRLVLVLLATLLAQIVIWYTLMDRSRAALAAKSRARDDLSATLDTARRQISEAAKTKPAVDIATHRLQKMEEKMPVGDPYRWLIKAFLDFPAATNVVLANIDPPHVSEWTLLPKVPYKTASFTLTGSAHYHQFGAFVAALENYFPHMRVKRLELSPGYPGEADSHEAEKLNFQLELMALFRATPALPPTQLSVRPVADKRN